MEMLADRLKELESEKEELSEYRNLDRERRALEFSIYNHQLQDCVGTLQSVDEGRSEHSAIVGQKYAELDHTRTELRSAQAQLLELAELLSSIDGQRDSLLEERKVLLQQQAKAKLDLQDKESDLKLTSTSKAGVTKQLREITAQVKSAHLKLAKLAKDFEAVSSDERNLAQEIGSVEGRLKDLLSRAGRQGQFKSAKERDSWIKKEIADIKMQIQRKEQQAQNLQQRILEFEHSREEDRKLIATRSKGLEERRKALEDASSDYEEKKSKRDEFNSKRKCVPHFSFVLSPVTYFQIRELWRDESEIDVSIQKHTELLRKAERRLQATMSKDLASGLATIDRLRSEGAADGVYGPIIELFDCDDRFMTSVEVAAGNALFHVVVDSDRTATRLVNALNDEKGGRVTFIPLNRLEVRDVSITRTEQVKPLVEVLKFKTTFEKAFMQIFGKTLLCGSMEVAANVARLNKMSCITLDGDQVSSRGAMSGGYYDPSSSRLSAHKEVKKFKALIAQQKQDREQLRARIGQLDQRIDSAVAEVAAADAERIKLREELDHFDLSCRNAAKQQLSSEEVVIQTNRSLTEVSVSIQALKDTQASLEQEMATPLTAMSDGEREELQDLSKKLPKLRQQMFEIGQKRVSLEGEKTEIENALSSHLLPKQDQLETALASGQLPAVDDAAHVRAELDKLDEKLQNLNEKIDALNEKKERSRAQEADLRDAVAALSSQEESLSSEVESQSRTMDKLMNKRHALTQKREDATKRLREVGSLPTDLTAKFSGKSSADCLLLLHSTNQQLKGYSHVNKKAFDQFTSFTDQREALVQRKQELDESEAAIAHLVETLDQHKDEAIERTVKGVSKYFSEIFSELTNGGKASLIKLVRFVPARTHCAVPN
jgi:structural maintenance of chromosome 3 (chondroitin sulfate proteoglycan 6)